MSLTPTSLRLLLIDAASRYFRGAGRFAYHFARGKLGGDPVFLALLERGLLPDRARILDLGCGQGLLAAWLLAARRQYEFGEWPDGWPEPGRPGDIRGVDLLASDIRRAAAALPPPARFEQGDMRFVDFAQADVVVIMDALHYVDFAAQNDVLLRVRDALPLGGLFLTRVGNAAAGLGFSSATGWIGPSPSFAATVCHHYTAGRCRTGLQRWNRWASTWRQYR
jgi:SAM-dependent methyltransferase